MRLELLCEKEDPWYDPKSGRSFPRKRKGADYVGTHGLRTMTPPKPAGPPGTPTTAMPTLHLTYPDAKEDKQPWILYLGTHRSKRHPSKNKNNPEKDVTYVMGIKLNKMLRDPSYSRLLGIIRNRIPDITKQSTSQGRARRIREIFRAFDRSGSDTMFKGVYRTYVQEPGLITKKHGGITASTPGEPFTYMSIDQVAQQWGSDEDRDETIGKMQKLKDLERKIYDLHGKMNRADKHGMPTDKFQKLLDLHTADYQELGDELEAGREEFATTMPQQQADIPGITPDRGLPDPKAVVRPKDQRKAIKPGEGIPTLQQDIERAKESAAAVGTLSSPQKAAQAHYDPSLNDPDYEDLADQADKM